MPTRNVVVTDHQADMIEKLVESGRYQNASEVLRDGLRLLARQEAEEKAKLKALREAARAGTRAIAAGRYRSFDSDEALRRHLAALTESALRGRGK